MRLTFRAFQKLGTSSVWTKSVSPYVDLTEPETRELVTSSFGL